MRNQTINQSGSVNPISKEISQNGLRIKKSLHHQFVKLGNDRRKLTNELLALIPEIFQKKIYKKYARSIFEYAAKFGGLTENVVRKRLRLEKYVYNKPILKEAIRTEGLHKVALVATLATKENERLLVDKLKNMSKPAIQELSKELRSKIQTKDAPVNQGLFASTFNNASVISQLNRRILPATPCQAVPLKITLDLDAEMTTMFLKLKKLYGEKLSNREVMKKIMEEILEMKDENVTAAKNTSKNSNKAESPSEKLIPGFRDSLRESLNEPQERYKVKFLNRHIPNPLKRTILQSTNHLCSYPNCNKPSENIHHPERFAESKNHNSLKPLCKIHHEFMHNGLISNQTQDPQNWQLSITAPISYSDHFYRHYRGR